MILTWFSQNDFGTGRWKINHQDSSDTHRHEPAIFYRLLAGAQNRFYDFNPLLSVFLAERFFVAWNWHVAPVVRRVNNLTLAQDQKETMRVVTRDSTLCPISLITCTFFSWLTEKLHWSRIRYSVFMFVGTLPAWNTFDRSHPSFFSLLKCVQMYSKKHVVVKPQCIH